LVTKLVIATNESATLILGCYFGR